MITEKELLRAIDECLQEPITGTKRSTLSDLYIIYDHLFGEPIGFADYGYSNKVEKQIDINGDTEFLKIVNGKNTEKVMTIIDELMEATRTLHPRMYDSVIRKIQDI